VWDRYSGFISYRINCLTGEPRRLAVEKNIFFFLFFLKRKFGVKHLVWCLKNGLKWRFGPSGTPCSQSFQDKWASLYIVGKSWLRCIAWLQLEVILRHLAQVIGPKTWRNGLKVTILLIFRGVWGLLCHCAPRVYKISGQHYISLESPDWEASPACN